MTLNKISASIVSVTFFINTTVFVAAQHTLVQNRIQDSGIDAAEIVAAEILLPQSDLRGEITQKLNAGEFKAELEKMGVNREEVQSRLAAMTDTELQQLLKGQHREAGGEVVVISVTVALLVILLLILLLRPHGDGGHTTVVT